MDGFRKRPGGGRAAVIGGAILLALVAGMLPAEAHSITGSQWTNVDQICVSGPCVSQGNLIGAWQSILWADGYLNKCGSSGIDGYFGTITKNATKTWQSAHGVGSDGIVGPVTWGEARSELTFEGAQVIRGPDGRVQSTVQYWDYVGKKHTVHFQYVSPTWGFRAPANPGPLPYYATSHPSIYFARC